MRVSRFGVWGQQLPTVWQLWCHMGWLWVQVHLQLWAGEVLDQTHSPPTRVLVFVCVGVTRWLVRAGHGFCFCEPYEFALCRWCMHVLWEMLTQLDPGSGVSCRVDAGPVLGLLYLRRYRYICMPLRGSELVPARTCDTYYYYRTEACALL